MILTLVQHGTQDQIDRWVRAALTGDEIWCQLFSEPEAGSDAAAVKTRAVRTDGGWIVNGQKVWTSGAQHCRWGFATVRTDPDAAKHAGVTMVVIDMEHPGVEVRPLRQITGGSDFNEVFFSDVFVPDADVVGEPNQGWSVARATLGNERVSIGGGVSGSVGIDVVALYREHGDRVPAAAERVGAYLPRSRPPPAQPPLRRTRRRRRRTRPGGQHHQARPRRARPRHRRPPRRVRKPRHRVQRGPRPARGLMRLGSRGMSIVDGTSEITRNQIAERILSCPATR